MIIISAQHLKKILEILKYISHQAFTYYVQRNIYIYEIQQKKKLMRNSKGIR